MKHFDKITLIFVLLLFVFSILNFSSEKPQINKLEVEGDYFEIKRKSGTEYFIFNKEISIMPGEKLNFYNQLGERVKSYEIKNILLPSRETIKIITDSGEVDGISRQEVNLDSNWRSTPGVFAVRQGKETIQIKLSEVKTIKAKTWLSIDADIEDLNDFELSPSFYQNTKAEEGEEYSPERLKWINPRSEENQSDYDLFTPPIIFIHNGELTTRLPEKEEIEEKMEPFGLSLTGVYSADYPLRLKSWVGQTPYFEDFGFDGDTKTAPVRNRIELGKPYKKVLDRKPGQPSLEICDTNDSEKLFTVQYFTVQQYRNPETGGLKPVGRAMVQDHRLGGKPFEINSLMREVNAGNFTLNFQASLPGLDPKNFTVESTISVETLEYGGRIYLVSDIDLENKIVKVTKQDPRIEGDLVEIFSF